MHQISWVFLLFACTLYKDSAPDKEQLKSINKKPDIAKMLMQYLEQWLYNMKNSH